MNFKETNRKYILFAVVLFVIIGIISAKVLASKQDDQFTQNELLYQQTSQLYSDGNYEEATLYSSELLKQQPDSEIANYLGGLIAAGNENYEQAVILMQKTLDINPHKVDDGMFMLQFGEALIQVDRKEDAKIVLQRCQDRWFTPEEYPEYQNHVFELLKTLENN